MSKFFDKIQEIAEQNRERIGPEVARGLEGTIAHGAHELAAALFTGSGFVMYARGDLDVHEPGKAVEGPEVQATPEVEQEQERGGMER